MAIAPAPIPIDRRLTDRARLDECRMELQEANRAELIFIRRVHGDASRVIRLIEGGLLAEAHSVAGGLVHQANRRIVQLRTPDGGAA